MRKNIIFIIIRLFTSQDVNFSELSISIRKVKNKITLVIAMTVLIFFSFIITKSFTSLLLNTYFKLIKVTVVESLEQLLDGDDCLIASTDQMLNLLNYYQVFDQKQIEVLTKRKLKYEENFELDDRKEISIFNESVFNDVVEGKAIILLSSYGINYFLEYFKRDIERIVVSDHKYIKDFTGFLIHKTSIFGKQQKFAFVYYKRNQTF